MRGNHHEQSNISSHLLLTACVLAVGFLGAAPVANAAAAGLPVLKAGESAKSHVIEIRGRARGPRFTCP